MKIKHSLLLFTIIVFVIIAIAACSEPIKSVKTEQTSNPHAKAELLFEKDGYKIHRFYDNGRAVYYITPQGQIHETHNENCGKSCTKEVSTQSVTVTNSNNKVK